MTTTVQAINERYLRDEGRRQGENRGSSRDTVEDVALFLATPVLGLGFALFYGLFGLAVIGCYGLKAIGVQCGLFSN